VSALGVEPVGVRRSEEPLPEFERMYAVDDLHEAIANADFVIVTVPLTDATRNLFDEAAFEVMREEAYFVNVARGAVVDESAPHRSPRSRRHRRAALDVFETEPLPEESPLWNMDEVIVTPHAAAYTRDYYRDVGDIVRDNVTRLKHGEEPVNQVV